MKKQYEYEVGGIKAPTRRTARELQRVFRSAVADVEAGLVPEPVSDMFKSVPKIVQTMTVQRVIR